jgi:hypothetical protein
VVSLCLLGPILPLLRPLLTSRSDLQRRPFSHKARSPRVRTHTFTAQSPHLRHFALVTRALQIGACSPCLAAPSMRFLFIDSRFTLHASFPHSVTLMQLRNTQARCDQLAAGLAPTGVRPCRAHSNKRIRSRLRATYPYSLCRPRSVGHPVFQHQTRHPFKLAHVVGDQGQARAAGGRCNVQLVHADGHPALSALHEWRSNAAMPSHCTAAPSAG